MNPLLAYLLGFITLPVVAFIGLLLKCWWDARWAGQEHDKERDL